jgi:ubiquitin-activating enzyme E1
LDEFFGKKISDKKYLLTDYSKLDRCDTHFTFLQAILDFREKHNKLPAPWSEEDANEVLKIANSLKHAEMQLNEEVLKLLAKTAAGDLSPMVTKPISKQI